MIPAIYFSKKNISVIIVRIADKILELHQEVKQKFPDIHTARLAISGSAGIGIADSCGLQFIQEVFAEKICTERFTARY